MILQKALAKGLARNACAGVVNGETKDLRFVVENDAEVSICTFDDEEGKQAFRHTASHVMAQAIKRLYPDTKLAIGPSIAEGFIMILIEKSHFSRRIRRNRKRNEKNCKRRFKTRTF